MDIYTEVQTDSDQCQYGEKVGTAKFGAQGKVVTVEMDTVGDFYMTESQVHVGADVLPTDNEDGTYITDPQQFELNHANLGNARSDFHYMRGCQENNWVVARAVVCGSFVS